MIRIDGHFGELLQGRLGSDVALVTLPCPALAVTASRFPGPFALHQPVRLLRPRQALHILHETGQRHARLILHADMPPGGGAGSSTAAILGLAGAGHPDDLARLCLRLEGAVDPLMYPAPERVLWASRRAAVLGRMPPLPRMRIVGGFLGEGLRTDPRDSRFPDISDLVAAWPAACASAADVARLASLSAARTQSLRGPADDPTPALAEAVGALGWARAHTGSARALILAPDTPAAPARRALQAAGLTRVVIFEVGQ